MPADEHKASSRRSVEKDWNQGYGDLIDELKAVPVCQTLTIGAQPLSREGKSSGSSRFRRVFPDSQPYDRGSAQLKVRRPLSG